VTGAAPGTESPTTAVTLGIDVGGTKMLGLALGSAGEVLAEDRLPSPHPLVAAPGDPEAAAALLEGLAALVEQLARAVADRGAPAATSIGVGVPGLVDDTGRLRYAPNLPAGDGMEVAARLGERVGLRVVADNDATCAAVAEWVLGAAAGATDAVMVTLGTGIGGGLVCGGKVMRGANGFAGEIGHMVVDPSGPQCSCGRRGCWERFASGSGLARLAREAAHAGRLASVVHLAGDDPDAVRGEHVAEAAASGDAEAQAVLEELGFWIALGLSNLALALDPEVMVIGGGLSDLVAGILPSVQQSMDSMLWPASTRPQIRIAPAALGERAGAIGAALVAREDDRYGAGRSRRAGAGTHGAPQTGR